MNAADRARQADDIARRLAGALRGVQLYAPSHPIVGRSLTALGEALAAAHASAPSVAIGLVGDQLIVGDLPIPRAIDTLGELMRRLQLANVERIVIDRGVEPGELAALVQALLLPDTVPLPPLAHVRVGRLDIDRRVQVSSEVTTFRRLYDDAVKVANRLWDSAATEGKPDTSAARTVVDSLAQAVAENRTALLALTALKDYDNYTFTHMVNVSILTMGQARGLGIDGALLREFGLAALLHDIGKVQTPPEILNKPERLTDGEFDILRRHPVDGAEILRQTPGMPPLAAIVAFEHHLRADGSGYPAGVTRAGLNLATTLCAIADVYDAMRSQRAYQEAFPSDRILAVLQRNGGAEFDQHLVRRFSQLVGIYPAGNLVRLDTGDIAVVTRVHAADPFRPRVRVVITSDGTTLDRPYDVNLWEPAAGQPRSVQAAVDPKSYGIDPLVHV